MSYKKQFEVKERVGQQLLGDFVGHHTADEVAYFHALPRLVDDEVQLETNASELLHPRADFQLIADLIP